MSPLRTGSIIGLVWLLGLDLVARTMAGHADAQASTFPPAVSSTTAQSTVQLAFEPVLEVAEPPPQTSAEEQHGDTCSAGYVGGWALRDAISCPPTGPVSCGVGAQPRCCPSGLVCMGVGTYVGHYCCAPGEDCIQDAQDSPQCPDPTWILYGIDGKLGHGGWCCLPGTAGVYWPDTLVGCLSADDPALPTGISWAQVVPTASRSSSCATSQSSLGPSSSASASAPAPVRSSSSSQAGPPVGAIAGIVVGVVGAVSMIIGLVLLNLKRRRRRRPEAIPEVATAMADDGQLKGARGVGGASPFEDVPSAELASGIHAAEMESPRGPGSVYEMDAVGR